MNKLIAIQTVYSRHGMAYRFIREDSKGLHRANYVSYDDLTPNTKNHIDMIICGHLVKRTYENIVDNSSVVVTYTIVQRPEIYFNDGIKVYQNLRGNLVIAADAESLAQMRESLNKDKFEYPQFDDFLWCLFENSDLEYFPDLGDAGFGLTSAPGIFMRNLYPEGHPAYNGSSDELGTDYDNSKLWVHSNYVFEHMLEAIENTGKLELHFVPSVD